MSTSWTKDPDAILDWAFDWSAWLAAGETIDSTVITVEDGITLDSDEFTDSLVTVWLSGGTIGEAYSIAGLITTNQGRTDERTFFIKVKER